MSTLMARFAAVAVLLFVAAGCSGGPSEADREAERRDHEQKFAALRNEMNQRFNDLERKYASALQIESKATSAVDEAKRMSKVTPVMVDFLKKQENSLQTQLEEVRALIKRLEAGN